jgi:biotin carboxylase
MNKPWVIHVGAGPWQASAIRRVRELGYRTLAVDGDPKAVGFEFADDFIVANIGSIEDVKIAVRAYFAANSEAPLAVVCTACEVGLLSAANLRQHFDLPGTRLDLARKLTNKGEQRRSWMGLSSPRFTVLSGPVTQIEPALSELRTERIIIKPIDSSGSRGITVVSRKNVRREHFDWALQHSGSNELIVEEFIHGREYTIESVRLNGKSYPILLTSKEKVSGTEATVANLLKSCRVEDDQAKAIHALVQHAQDALGYDNGVCHTEVIEDTHGFFWLVETAGRGAGFGVSEHFIKYATGYDYFEASLRFDLGLPVEEPPSGMPDMISAVRFLESTPGILVEVVNESDTTVYPLLEPGTVMSAPKTDGDRVAYFYIKGDTPEAVDQKIIDVLGMIRIGVNEE